jgi:hypothetical protein
VDAGEFVVQDVQSGRQDDGAARMSGYEELGDIARDAGHRDRCRPGISPITKTGGTVHYNTVTCAFASRLPNPLQYAPSHGQCSESAVKDTSHVPNLSEVSEERAQVRELGVVGIIKPRRDRNRIIGVKDIRSRGVVQDDGISDGAS